MWRGSWRGFPPGIETDDTNTEQKNPNSVARGGASRQGLKLIQCQKKDQHARSGSWRGFPPGIETKYRADDALLLIAVARGGASRQGLKLSAH